MFPVPDGAAYGGGLGTVTGLYNVGIRLACRMTERSTTAAILLSGKMPVRAIDQLLKRAGVGAARVCTGVATRGVDRSVRALSRGLRSVRGGVYGTVRWPLGRAVVGRREGVVAVGRFNGMIVPGSVRTATVDR